MSKKEKVEPANNFVKKYMDRLTKPQTHKSGKDYNRQSFKKVHKQYPIL